MEAFNLIKFNLNTIIIVNYLLHYLNFLTVILNKEFLNLLL